MSHVGELYAGGGVVTTRVDEVDAYSVGFSGFNVEHSDELHFIADREWSVGFYLSARDWGWGSQGRGTTRGGDDVEGWRHRPNSDDWRTS